MIELTNISKTYQGKSGAFQALKSINLTVPAGEIFGVIGKSGAGKSSLLRCVNLLEKPTSGTVRLDGKDLSSLSSAALRETRHEIGMIFQHFNLLSQRTVYQNIALPLELMGKSKRDVEQAVLPLLTLTGLQDKQHAYPKELSGGQKQRVAIARALAAKPKVLLCDEATSALDQHTTQSILQLLKDINQTLGLTILLITHEIDVVKQICDRVALIHEGEVIEQDTIYEFFTNPKTELATQFVKSSLRHDLPPALAARIISTAIATSNPVLRIIFHGKSSAEPLVAHLMQQFGIKLNILQANIEFLKNDTLGIMVTEVIDHPQNLESGLAYFKQQGVNVEVIGYVNHHA